MLSPGVFFHLMKSRYHRSRLTVQLNLQEIPDLTVCWDQMIKEEEPLQNVYKLNNIGKQTVLRIQIRIPKNVWILADQPKPEN